MPDNLFLICQSQSSQQYQFFQFNPLASNAFTAITLKASATIPSGSRLAQIGGYLLNWQPVINTTKSADSKPAITFSFTLSDVDPHSNDPLNSNVIRSGAWDQFKFWGYRSSYSGNPNEYQNFELIPMGSFMLSLIPAAGRGTFQLWNFDPQYEAKTKDGDSYCDPLPTSYSSQGGFALIKQHHQLLPINNYVLDRLPDGVSFRLWNFDPGLYPPLALPAIQTGTLSIDKDDALIAAGDYFLSWNKSSGAYKVWGFDPTQTQVLTGPVAVGTLPAEISPTSTLTAYQTKTTITQSHIETPGTMDFMRSKIKNVVYYMLESRSFDNACGWLYEKDPDSCHFIGSTKPFEGVSEQYSNRFNDKKYPVSQFKNGELSNEWALRIDDDPFHDTTDGLQQMFEHPEHYWQKKQPDMKGFVLNAATPSVMETYTPHQLPILNGLAKHFGVSDQWFSSMPGGTDANRAYAVTGSAYDRLGTWEGGEIYNTWPQFAHRQSLWKVLWSQGIKDWKIYSSILWQKQIFTYQLYLSGQIPTVDNAVSADPTAWPTVANQRFDLGYLASLDKFVNDAKNGTLPAFSFLEPAWINPPKIEPLTNPPPLEPGWVADNSTSYHPGGDIVPAEVALNHIYNALRTSPQWQDTLLVITFDKNNGLYDHMPPPYARKAWPNDENNGFKYDLMGPRVPTIMVSPWIKKHSVLRASGDTPFDSTSFAATLLSWFGIPKSQWSLGERMNSAPTFEQVLQQAAARTDAPVLTPPYDKNFPKPTQKEC